MTTTTRTDALHALTDDELSEAASALSGHIQAMQKILVLSCTTEAATYWQGRLDASLRALDHVTAARIAE